MNDFWFVVSKKKIKELQKMHIITHNSITNRGSTLISTNLVEVYPRAGMAQRLFMDCHATARCSIPSGHRVKTDLHILCKGQ